MTTLQISAEVKTVTEVVKVEVPLPIYLQIDAEISDRSGEYLYVSEDERAYYVYACFESKDFQIEHEFLSYSEREGYYKRFLKDYKHYETTKEYFENFKNKVIKELL